METVALVGRPNVGKSRLFNRLASRRLAIVHDQAGVTRDVNSTVVKNHYTLLDTGGIGLVVDMDHEKLIEAAEAQVWLAIEAADLICFVVDGREGLTALDETIAEKLRESGKRVILAVNKIDHEGMEDQVDEFTGLGFETYFPVSAEHGYNSSQLEREIEVVVGPAPEETDEPEEYRIHIAFAGRPNVGKSSLCNHLLADERLVVSEVPGTTRDSVMLDLDFQTKDEKSIPFRLVDTAGLRKRKRVSHSIEYFSTLRTRQSIERSDIVFLVVDAESGVTRQDKALAGEIMDAGKCVALLVNKWDLAIDRFRGNHPDGYENMEEFKRAYAASALSELFFLPDSPVLFVSALRGFSMDKVLNQARALWETSGRTLSTPKVNAVVHGLIEKKQPRYIDNKRFKAYYAVQTGNRPFRFKLFCNRATKLDDGYRRYLQKGFIKNFKLQGCPVQFELRGKEKRYADMGKKGSRR
ncbi:ribosome biogenesis GTPase Der [Puniceicoccales bacterium CK1056]|uniref:GTPase Der n=1 Tax=Oceanipulchritudo coccoides TaxID=2706888 RepID=A0A6B2M4F3_9BACT|nr:ribosome biogenesis GTPase Der [Oceanipulchritudo coccoides]NDV62520.1 ribosome biogenesis GTPase Der [Oceanipulchritudo coccoides]